MKDELADYLADLEAQNYSHSRLVHVRRAIKLLMLYLKEAPQRRSIIEGMKRHVFGFIIFVILLLASFELVGYFDICKHPSVRCCPGHYSSTEED